MIRTPEYLTNKRKELGITQLELSERTGVSYSMIQKIEIGSRIGTYEIWEKLSNVLEPNEPQISVDSDDIIEVLKEDIDEYGNAKKCNVFYKEQNGFLIFKDYLLDEDMKHSHDELKSMNTLRVTLKEALELFEKQNKLL